MNDDQYILATAHFVQDASRARRSDARLRALAAYAQRRVREIVAARRPEPTEGQ